MTVKEIVDSETTTIAIDGTTFERVFHLSNAEWNDGSLGILPGDAFGDNEDLRVTHIRKRIVPGQKDLFRATVFYSTESSTAQERRADEIQSWEETIDFGFIETDDDTFSSFGLTANRTVAGVTTSAFSSGVFSFDSAYSSYRLTASAAGIVVPATAPLLPQRKAVADMVVRTYSATLHVNRIQANMLTTNSRDFIRPYFTTEQGTGIQSDAAGVGTDIGLWLFTGCPTRRINKTTWEHAWTFEFSPFIWRGERMRWNEPFGFPVNNYFEIDFLTLFDGMRLDTAQTLLQGNR